MRLNKPPNYIFKRSNINIPATTPPINTHRGPGAFTEADFSPPVLSPGRDNSPARFPMSPGHDAATPRTPATPGTPGTPTPKPRRPSRAALPVDDNSLREVTDGVVAAGTAAEQHKHPTGAGQNDDDCRPQLPPRTCSDTPAHAPVTADSETPATPAPTTPAGGSSQHMDQLKELLEQQGWRD